MEVGKREIIYLSLHCHHQNDSYIKMGSDESRFNVSLIVRDKVTRQCPQTTTFVKREESRTGIEPEVLEITSRTAGPNRLTRQGHRAQGSGRAGLSHSPCPGHSAL